MRWCLQVLEYLRPKQDLRPVVELLANRAAELAERNDDRHREHMEAVAELIEARQMAGAGPWRCGPAVLAETDRLIAHAQESLQRGFLARETVPVFNNAGAYGDIELALQNVQWRREVNFSWLEFSRWGIQQIILVSRLYYMKNPIIRRLVDVTAAYVFARGVEISSPEEALNEEIDAYVRANPKVLGHVGLCRQERAKDTDGNIFWIFFDDKESTGEGSIRTIEPTEIEEIVCDPDDSDTEWYFHRIWVKQDFDAATGVTKSVTDKVWYPAVGYDPIQKPDTIRGDRVEWDAPVLHSKTGFVGKWRMGCPRIYPALDWAKEGRRLLEACASVKQSNAQIARTISQKGGQQAMMGMKQQLGTTVGPAASLLDQNPPSVAGSTWVSGPGTQLELMQMRGKSDDPEEVRQYKLMCCMVAGVPETFLGDVSIGNLATANSLDRPTETVMLEKQESWREDLAVIMLRHLNISKNAPSGRVREALKKKGINPAKAIIRECRRVPAKDGRGMKYATLEMRKGQDGKSSLYEADRAVPDNEILVKVNFPAIREGDLKTLVDALIASMTLGNRAGQVIGIDEKEGIRKLYDLNGFDDGDELVEEQYPESEYEIDRTKIELPAPIPKAPEGMPAGTPAANVQGNQVEAARIRRALGRIENALANIGENGNH